MCPETNAYSLRLPSPPLPAAPIRQAREGGGFVGFAFGELQLWITRLRSFQGSRLSDAVRAPPMGPRGIAPYSLGGHCVHYAITGPSGPGLHGSNPRGSRPLPDCPHPTAGNS